MRVGRDGVKAALAALLLALVLAQLLAALARPLMDGGGGYGSSEAGSGSSGSGSSSVTSDSYWDAQYKRYSSYERNLEGSGYGGSSGVGSSSSSGTSTGSPSGSSSGLLGAVGNALSGAAQAVASAVSSAARTIGRAVSGALDTVANTISYTSDAVSSVINTVGRALSSAVDSALYSLTGYHLGFTDRSIYTVMGVTYEEIPNFAGTGTKLIRGITEASTSGISENLSGGNYREYSYSSGTRMTPYLSGGIFREWTSTNQPDVDVEPVQRHRECVNGRCVLVLGPGEDQCRTDADCQCPLQNINPPSFHAECVSMRCVLVPGSGQDQCRTDADCSPPKDRLIFDLISIQPSTTKGGSGQTPPPGETPLATLARAAERPRVVEVGMGTPLLPGEGIATPWLADVSNWAWNGTWLLNVTELYRVNEHIVALLTDGSNVEVVPLPNGTSLRVHLPAGWRGNKHVMERGGMKVTVIPRDEAALRSTFPSVSVGGRTWYLVALAAWDPYKLLGGGYDTGCWLANGTTLAVYNLTFTYTFQNGTKVVFKEPVVVSTLKVTATPDYSIGELKQGLSLKVTASWKYLPPAASGVKPTPPGSIVGVVVIGNRVYEGALIDANSTSKTFLVKLTDDTWALYSQGINSVVASAYWLSSMGTPEGPVALQEPAQLSVVYVMPHIDAISEGSSLTATISIFDVKTDETYSADIYIELRDNRTFAVVWRDSARAREFVPGRKTITRSIPNTKQYVLAIYAIPAPQSGKLVVPIPAVYPPRA